MSSLGENNSQKIRRLLVVNSIERVLRTVNLKEADRVPVAPYMCFFEARACGAKIRDFVFDPMCAWECSKIVFEKLGGPDIYAHVGAEEFFTPNPDPFSVFWFEWKMPGVDLHDDAYPAMVEISLMDEKAYKVIAEEGLTERFRIRNELDVKEHYRIDVKDYFSTVEKVSVEQKKWLERKRVLPMGGAGMGYHPIDLLSYMRGMKDWLVDCFLRSDDILAAAERIYNDQLSLYMRRRDILSKDEGILGVKTGGTGSHRTSASFLSPRLFEKLGFPFLKRTVDELAKVCQIITLHLDGYWSPLLEYLREFPKGKCILQFDCFTDIAKAKEAIGDHCCLMGNIHPTMLSTGTTSMVKRECKRLIEACKEGGGFILSSSCEVPANAPFQNVMAMRDAALKYGSYK